MLRQFCQQCTCVSNGDAHKVDIPPLLFEFIHEGLVFLCFFLKFGFEVEVGAKSHFDEQEGACGFVKRGGIGVGDVGDSSGVD